MAAGEQAWVEAVAAEVVVAEAAFDTLTGCCIVCTGWVGDAGCGSATVHNLKLAPFSALA